MMPQTPTQTAVSATINQMATAVREACISAATAAYENARSDGLCHEGAWEVALNAMQQVHITNVLTQPFAEK